MTWLAVPITVRTAEQALAQAAKAAEAGADLIEYRIDQVIDQHALIQALLQRAPLPCILTCRLAEEGGSYAGSQRQRLDLLQELAASGDSPAYVDLELLPLMREQALRDEVRRLVAGSSGSRSHKPALILSTHDFTTRPADLLQRFEAMVSDDACSIAKLAWQARSLRDNIEAFEILQQRSKPTIALCMGDAGLPSRVLAKKFGAMLTFAALSPAEATAPGQVTVETLKRLYRWDRLGPQTRVYGVIGHPVSHSKSPAIHNAGFDAVGHDGVYLPLPIPPEYEHFKATMLTWLDYAPLHFRGASVTIPHKQNLLRFVAEQAGEIEPLAASIGAANTLVVRDAGEHAGTQALPRLYACNTDYAAALDSVCDGLGITREGLRGKRVAVIGAGGAARAIVAGFAHYGSTVVVYNRTLANAEELAAAFNGRSGKVVAARLEKLCDSCCEIYINCTPVGMHPHVDATPMPDGPREWGPGTLVFDTIYNPVQTRWLREAAAAGCVTVSGVEMFVRQAAAQFELWTGVKAPVDVFRKVLG